MKNLGNALGNISNNKSTIEQLYDSIDTSSITRDIGEIVIKNAIAKDITDDIIASTANKLKKLIPSVTDAKKLLQNEKGSRMVNKGLLYIDICYSGLMFQLKNLLSKTEYNRIDMGFSKVALAGYYNSNKKDRVAKDLKIDPATVDRVNMSKPDTMVNRIMNKAYGEKTINIIDGEKISKMATTIENTLNAESNKDRINKFQTQESLKKIQPQLVKLAQQIKEIINTNK